MPPPSPSVASARSIEEHFSLAGFGEAIAKGTPSAQDLRDGIESFLRRVLPPALHREELLLALWAQIPEEIEALACPSALLRALWLVCNQQEDGETFGPLGRTACAEELSEHILLLFWGKRREMLDVIAELNGERFRQVGDPEISTRIAQYEMAYRMQMSVPELTDFSNEPESTFKLYGPFVDIGTDCTLTVSCYVCSNSKFERIFSNVELFLISF